MSQPQTYRKKPVVVEAMQLLDDIRVHVAIADWISSHGGTVVIPPLDPHLIIRTLEGDMRAELGDWIIRGTKGEFYPCKPDVFADVYEPAEAVRPRVVCLCGSTRFSHAFREANLRETLAGRIVLTIGCDMRTDTELFADLGPKTAEGIKAALDELHKRKIDLADEILVLNVGGYIGASTRTEIEYAEEHGKTVRWLEEYEELADGNTAEVTA